jgi:DNA-binding MarR family transcriptional regulator
VSSTPATPAELATSLEVFLQQLMCLKHDANFDSLAELELSITQFRALSILSQAEEAIPIHELADRLHLSVAATGRNIDALVGKRLVLRKEDPLDRRVKRISLSADGGSIVSGMDTHRREALHKFAASLDPDQRQQLHAAIVPLLPELAGTSPSSPKEHHA